MKHLTFIYLLATILLAQGCFAQYKPVKVEVSEEMVTLNGHLYYLHKVKKRETLYSIAKAYGTEIKTIKEHNPSLESGLKENDLLYIKFNRDQHNQQPRKEKTETQIENEKKKLATGFIDTLNIRYQAEHTVKWFESLSAISKKYGVTEEEIIIANSLENNKVQTRQVLKIPYPGAIANITGKADDKTEQGEEQKEEMEDEFTQDLFRKGFEKINASLLIPLGGENDTTFYKEENRNRQHNFLDFYQGFLLAVENLKKNNPGIQIDLQIIDTDNYVSTSEIIELGLLKEKDIVIGPVYEDQLQPVLDYCKKEKIYVVSPMDSQTEHYANQYSNFFQITTPISYQQRGILSAVNMFSRVTIIFEKNGRINDPLVEATTKLLKSSNIRYNILSYGILDGRSIIPSILEQLDQGSLNHIIVASESEAFVSDVLRNLNLIKSQNEYELTVYGTPRWRHFETIDISYYHDMNLNISMQYYIDYSRGNIKSFLGKYRALYNSEPSPYAFQAYDIASYFFGNMFKSGKHFLNNASDYKIEMLQSDYDFSRKSNNEGYINTAVRRVIYKPDYSITDIRGFFR